MESKWIRRFLPEVTYGYCLNNNVAVVGVCPTSSKYRMLFHNWTGRTFWFEKWIWTRWISFVILVGESYQVVVFQIMCHLINKRLQYQPRVWTICGIGMTSNWRPKIRFTLLEWGWLCQRAQNFACYEQIFVVCRCRLSANKIWWEDPLSYSEVKLMDPSVQSLEAALNLNRFRCLENVLCMLPESLLYCMAFFEAEVVWRRV